MWCNHPVTYWAVVLLWKWKGRLNFGGFTAVGFVSAGHSQYLSCRAVHNEGAKRTRWRRPCTLHTIAFPGRPVAVKWCEVLGKTWMCPTASFSLTVIKFNVSVSSEVRSPLVCVLVSLLAVFLVYSFRLLSNWCSGQGNYILWQSRWWVRMESFPIHHLDGLDSERCNLSFLLKGACFCVAWKLGNLASGATYSKLPHPRMAEGWLPW